MAPGRGEDGLEMRLTTPPPERVVKRTPHLASRPRKAPEECGDEMIEGLGLL